MRWSQSSLPPVIATLLAACARQSPPAEPVPATSEAATPAVAGQSPHDDVGTAVRAALDGDWEARYFDAQVDLNGDGQAEVIVYAAGPMVCGTGGCPLYVFTPAADGYRLVSTITVVRTPVRLSPRRSNGWRNLVVGIAGGGLPAGTAELEFDGKAYASNPTAPPAKPLTDLDGVRILIPDFQSYTEGKPVPAGSYGDPAVPVAGEVLGTNVHTEDAEELRYLVLQKLTDRYAQMRDIEVTQDEREAYARHVKAALKDDPNFENAPGDSAEDAAARFEIGGAFIKQWKINRALWEQYGGRIIFQQAGPEPLDACRKFLEESQAQGDFRIENPALESGFWSYYRDASIHSFYAPGSAEERAAFAMPPWESG
jgi:hypothetical protein